jgi:hypothetical protein
MRCLTDVGITPGRPARSRREQPRTPHAEQCALATALPSTARGGEEGRRLPTPTMYRWCCDDAEVPSRGGAVGPPRPRRPAPRELDTPRVAPARHMAVEPVATFPPRAGCVPDITNVTHDPVAGTRPRVSPAVCEDRLQPHRRRPAFRAPVRLGLRHRHDLDWRCNPDNPPVVVIGGQALAGLGSTQLDPD